MTAEQQAQYSYNEFQMDNLQREMVQRINSGGASDNYMQRVTDEVNRLRRENNKLRYGR